MTEKIEKLLIWVLILTVAFTIFSFYSKVLPGKLYGPAYVGQLTAFGKLIAIGPSISKLLINVCIAVWLFNLARKYKARQWAWFVLGVFFGLMAAILFFLVQIFEILQSEKAASHITTRSSERGNPRR